MIGDTAELRQEIVRIGQLMYDKGLVVGADGNISARVGRDSFLVTPSGLPKGMLQADQLIVVDGQGRPVGSYLARNRNLTPTSELHMHLEAYRQRPDVNAVVHAHPPTTIALSIAGISMIEPYLPETLVMLGEVPTAPYSLPSSSENADAIRELILTHDAIVLQRHGSLTVGRSILEAFLRLETLEQTAKVLFMLAQLGDGNPRNAGKPLTPEQIRRLIPPA